MGLDDFLAALPLEDGFLSGGGSNAEIRRFSVEDRPYVVKYVRAGTALVDGHDSLTLATKADQLRLIAQRCPRLARRFAMPTEVYQGTDGAAIVMPYYPGAPLIELAGESPDAFRSALAQILEELIAHGYSVSRTPAPPGSFAAVHIGRIQRRLSLLRQRLPPKFLADGLTANGESGLGIAELLERLRSRAGLMRMLDPPALTFPLHGDLNLSNILLRSPGDYTILDPRGVLEPWDIVYDLAKMLFSLAGLYNGMRYGFAIGHAASGLSVRVREGQTPAFQSLADGFRGLVGSISAFRRLGELDPHWTLRLQFSVAMHALAEAPCRFSDRKPRTIAGARGMDSQIELAAGLHLMGAITAARLLRLSDEELAAPDVPRVEWQA